MSNANVKPEELRIGQVLFKWHDSGVFGPTPMYCEVVRVNRKTITIRWLASGILMRLSCNELHVADDEDAVRQEYIV